MKNIQTEIIINAAPATVWKTLINFEAYADWNPFIHITGEAKEGTTLKSTFFLDGQKPQTFHPKILEVKPTKAFRWEGHLFVKGLFDGEHYFRLEALPNFRTRFIHGENFKGILSGLIFKMIAQQTEDGFRKMNEALKTKCEAYQATELIL